MATKTINLEAAVNQILNQYSLEVTDEMKTAVKEAVKVGAKKVRENAQASFNGKEYAKGWTSTLQEGRLSSQGIIYNGKLPGLPHLLENGHAKRGGGRVNGVEHIRPVEEELENLITRELERKL